MPLRLAGADLPPEPNADGTYTFPSAATPFAFPQFPFANPPYAARSYSYVSVATYEALKVAWHYKYLYNRPTPANVDHSIQAFGPVSDLPAYPSEDAVVSSVSAALLKVLFPTQVAFISQKAAEQEQAAILSGRASASDIAAGEALGNAVAAIFVARAGADGLKAATGTQTQWDALAAAATARGEIPWKSLENPPRPPMLPFFGQVQAWMMSPTNILNERPGPPPSTSSTQMQTELAGSSSLRQEPDARTSRAIAYKSVAGRRRQFLPDTPGHWNVIADTYIESANFSEVSRTARAQLMVNMVALRRRRAVPPAGISYCLLQSAPDADGSESPDRDCVTQLPFLRIRPFRILRRRGSRSIVFVSGECRLFRPGARRSRTIAPLRRYSLSLRHRNRQDPWRSRRWLHGQVRAGRWSRIAVAGKTAVPEFSLLGTGRFKGDNALA